LVDRVAVGQPLVHPGRFFDCGGDHHSVERAMVGRRRLATLPTTPTFVIFTTTCYNEGGKRVDTVAT